MGRPGGDEFIVVIDKIEHEDEAVRVGHDLLETVARPFHYGEHRIEVSASIGLALYPRDGSTPDELLSSADTAMYAAKSRGGNALESYAPQLRRVTLEQIELERALRGALDRGAVDVAYQPIVDAKTGKIVSFEALVRWTENGEIIEPSRFVPLAESTGLIVRLGTFVLQRACAQARLWLNDHPELRICINISAHQFRDPAFLDCVRTTLEETGVPPDRLNLEITESAYMGADVGVSNVRNLEALGIGMSIDDLRHGVLVARISQTLAGRRAEDRSIVHLRHRFRSRGSSDRARDHRRRAESGTDRDRGRRGDVRASRVSRGARLHVLAGLLFRAPAHGGRRYVLPRERRHAALTIARTFA